ncbi:PIR protein [Plasmodium malariae]|uniref:PIR protein n=1 Tax=Plasmodium malariae TaxID=5858 RepID=A0A1D3P9Y8_PLAMA|nr:PIR protein [Plasmodium malariae]SCN12008.1 PIR protein [Plasmodium malariae]
MASEVIVENDNCVELFLRYKKDFDKTIQDFYDKTPELNPGKTCATVFSSVSNFTEACQEIGVYLMKIQKYYFSERIRRCKYLNYRINNEEKYNKPSNWFDEYNKFSSKLDNICEQKFEVIKPDILNNLKKLYSYYDAFHKYDGTNGTSNEGYCNKIQECYNFYIKHYDKCQKNKENAFCEELSNFKKAYDNKMRKVAPCSSLPHILPPTQVDYIFVTSLTTSIALLTLFTLFFLYKFTPLKSWLHSRLKRKTIIELEEETTNFLQNIQEEVDRIHGKSFHNISYQPRKDI